MEMKDKEQVARENQRWAEEIKPLFHNKQWSQWTMTYLFGSGGMFRGGGWAYDKHNDISGHNLKYFLGISQVW